MTHDTLADLVLRGGRIATMDTKRTFAAALAVRDGRIVAVGGDDAVRDWIGPRTRVVELGGRSVTPGFGDAHVHPVSAGVGQLRCDLSGARGLDTYLEIIGIYAATHPDEPWIRGDGWSMADFPGGIPDRADLDRIVPDRPVYLDSRDGHTGWVNSKALELAGVTADTLDSADGRIERDADGRPSGALQEGAVDLVAGLLPADTPDELVAGLRLAQAELHALGVTNWQDASVSPESAEVAYTTLAGRGELTARVVGALWWDRARGAEQIEGLVDRRARTAIGRYAPTSVKLFQDGVLENGTGAVLEPYLGDDGQPTTNRGMSMIDPEALKTHVTSLDALGFQPHFHAIGERAVREALDAVEAARRANGTTDTRPHIAHIQVIHPDDIGRFRELGVIANAQPYWACHEAQMDELTIPRLGPERSGWQYPFASLPAERLDLMDALAAFTSGTARVNHLEGEVGSIEVGKAADLVVLDRDLFDRGAGAIGEARVVATFIDGIAVHEAPTLEG